MTRPQLYINVSQTMAVGLLGLTVISYIFNKAFRKDVNDTIKSVANGDSYRRGGYNG